MVIALVSLIFLIQRSFQLTNNQYYICLFVFTLNLAFIDVIIDAIIVN